MAQPAERDLSRHRPNVGIVLFNGDGQVWLGRRAKSKGRYRWQFPQGGVDEGEDLYAAALRELEEETGVTSVALLGRTEGWVAYDFPQAVLESRAARGWAGQKQAWFALRFTGADSEVRLDAHEPVEFDTWRWGALSEAPALIVPFKRKVYRAVVRAFSTFAAVTE